MCFPAWCADRPENLLAARSRPRSVRSIVDEALLAEITHGHAYPFHRSRRVRGPQGVAPAAPWGHFGWSLPGRTVDANRWPSRGPPRKIVCHDQVRPGCDASAGPGGA